MLLVTLGYDATKAGLTGANWASKTNALADENGLLEDVNTSFTAACPRQYAAQLIYNAIELRPLFCATALTSMRALPVTRTRPLARSTWACPRLRAFWLLPVRPVSTVSPPLRKTAWA